MSDDDINTPEAVDLATFVPESFKGEDDKWDTSAFRASYDDLASFKAAADDRAAALPKDAAGYEFALPEDHKLPEGFDPESLSTTDEKGNKIEFNAAAMIDPSDPDVAALQAILHEAQAEPGLAKKLAGLMVNREIRATIEAQRVAAEHLAELGPTGKGRIQTVKGELARRLPANYANAISDSITSADALRGIEQLIRGTTARPVTPADDKVNYSDLNPRDRVLHGLKQREKRA